MKFNLTLLREQKHEARPEGVKIYLAIYRRLWVVGEKALLAEMKVLKLKGR
ncbi:MAG: hypothetical protein LC100_00185 [Chitinophagales bacterium]|nr:hypothetical protein [Chitinophagales bacterium]